MLEARGALVLTVVALGALPASAELQSLSVSPGRTDGFAPIADPCPTFSWSHLREADGYELVVYELPALEELAHLAPEALERLQTLEPDLRLTLPRTTSWTPDLDRCLERSRSYAWLVRALADPTAGEFARWSEPRFFTIGRREREHEPTPRAEPLPLEADPQRSSTSEASLVAKLGNGARTDDLRTYPGYVPEGALAAVPSQPSPDSVGRVTSEAVFYPGPARIHATASNPSGTAFGVRGVVTSANPAGVSSGVYGESTVIGNGGIGVLGVSRGEHGSGVLGRATEPFASGVVGVTVATDSDGVFGWSQSATGTGVGVIGQSSSQDPGGLGGYFLGYNGVRGQSYEAGSAGEFINTGGGYLLSGCNASPCTSPLPFYVEGDGDLGAVTVSAHTNTGSFAIRGLNQGNEAFARGVLGESSSATGRGVFGDASSTSGDNAGVAGRSFSPNGVGGVFLNVGGGDILRGLAGSNEVFRVENDGTVFADGAYNCGLSSGCFNAGQGADLAERIDPLEPLLPGEVVEIDPGSSGRFRKSRGRYSHHVVGVISDRAAITLNNNDLAGGRELVGSDRRPLVALAGVVPVRVSGEGGAIRPGDLLVASSTPGVAMRCARPRRCRGATIGKALETHDRGAGLVMMMVFPN